MHAYDALTAISSVLFPYNQGIFFNKNNPSPVDSWRKGEGCPLAIFSYSFPSRFNQSAWNHYQRQLCVCFRAFLLPAFTGKAMLESRYFIRYASSARERERREGGWRSSWFAASVINVRALEASLDHIAFVINRFGGSLGLRRHYVLYVSLQISFSVVRGPVHVRARPLARPESHPSHPRTGRDRKEREKNLSWDDGERTRQKWMLPYAPVGY